MNSRIFITILFVATTILFLTTAYAQISKKTNTDAVKASPSLSSITNTIGDTTSAPADSGYWTCTMHPDIHKNISGNCLICGMKLVFIKNDKDTLSRMSMDHTDVKK